MTDKHKKIWLQYYDEGGEPVDEVTWHSEPVFDTDVRYVLEE